MYGADKKIGVTQLLYLLIIFLIQQKELNSVKFLMKF